MSNHRTDEIERLSEIFGALSNPNRLVIFLRLVECCGAQNECSTTTEGLSTCVGDIAEGLGLAKSTVSHHLKELRRANLIHMHRSGKYVECSLNTSAVGDLSALVETWAAPQKQTNSAAGQGPTAATDDAP